MQKLIIIFVVCLYTISYLYANSTRITPEQVAQWEAAGLTVILEEPLASEEKATEAPDSDERANEIIYEAVSAEPPDKQAVLAALFSFDTGLEPDYTSEIEVPVEFKRESPAYFDGTEYAPDKPRFVDGKFGRALLLEEGRANYLSLNQSIVEKGLQGFESVNNASLSVHTADALTGNQSLRIVTSGEGNEEGFTVQTKIEKFFYNGQDIMPAVYLASIYAKGQGYLQMRIKAPENEATSEPVFFELSDQWQRFSCLVTFKYEPLSIGKGMENEWKDHLQGGTELKADIKLACTTTDNQQTEFLVDGLLLERRHLAYPHHGKTISPLSWIPGGTEVMSEKLTIDTSDKKAWQQQGTISFWFKPHWDAKDGTRETLLHVDADISLLEHAQGSIRMTSGDISLVPYDWQNEWQHIAIVWDTSSDKHSLYIDGFEYPGKRAFNNKMSFLTFHANDTAPNGIIDDLALFRAALTTEQIRSLAFEGKPMKPREPVEEIKAFPSGTLLELR